MPRIAYVKKDKTAACCAQNMHSLIIAGRKIGEVLAMVTTTRTTTKGNIMNNTQAKKDLEIAAAVSPIVLVTGLAAVAGIGYLVWTNRSKLQKFFKDQNLDQALTQATEFVSEGAAKIGGLLNVDVKPLTNSIQSTSDKAHSVNNKVASAK